MKKIRILYCLWAAMGNHYLHGVSIVYNMRIVAPPTYRQELYKKLGVTLPSIAAMIYLNQQRTVKNGNKQSVNAGLAEYLYTKNAFYFRFDTAIGHVHEDIKIGGSTSHTQPDDLLFAAGYQQSVKPTFNMTYSFLVGMPTHKDRNFQYFQFGTGHWALGGQIDTIYVWGDQPTNALLTAVRLLHFYPAQTKIPTTTEPLCVDFHLGNLFDMFIAYHKKLNNHHVEFGYNPSFALSVSTSPALPTPVPSHGIRNNWYGTYRYLFVTKHHPMGFLVGLSYGSDIIPKVVGLKRVVTCWGAYGINF